MAGYYTYIVRCADRSLYAGWTTDVKRRVRAHNRGTGAKYTRARRPVRLVWQAAFATKREAMRWEWKIKQLSKAQKEALCCRRQGAMYRATE
ncbi:GIY-YIG nuclease family protein [Megasphaera lornae]|jgi:GIY-YIG catalytic domain protein|uniref:GIY-YIG catalytic domain protein n=1 Tax=Megasphaera lornae TaxID=1000568 RepID=D3LSQ3_9FIRM|nr:MULTISPECIES: GIY-YIG nuclease family protein [Megasphaera]EFD94687.1 GIY-YIG catalytic domain protein [Megasphaera genomosp. type_1 str. 28L]EGL39427.1 GIY-YIG catalytic domain protein [Megasphaera lornae]